MVSSTGSRVESAIFQRVIGSLGGAIDFGGDVDACHDEADWAVAEGGNDEDIESISVLEIGHAEQ